MAIFSENGPVITKEWVKKFFEGDFHWKWKRMMAGNPTGQIHLFQYFDGSEVALKFCVQDVNAGRGNRGTSYYYDGDYEDYEGYDDDDDDYSYDEPDAGELLSNEKAWLKKLRSCPHIIQILNLSPDVDPLTGRIMEHQIQDWIYMEHAGDVSLNLMVLKHRIMYGGEPLPNRILWGIFLCLLRACVEMAFFNAEIDNKPIALERTSLETLKQIPPGLLAHNSLRGENLMIPDWNPDLNDPEHNVTPLLQLIDFGQAEEISPDDDFWGDGGPQGRDGSRLNLADIAMVMQMCILQNPYDPITYPTKHTVTVRWDTFDTWGATPLALSFDELTSRAVDPDLLATVFYCLAFDVNKQPNLVEVAMYARAKIEKEPPLDDPRESRKAVRDRMHALAFNAETEERAEDEDDSLIDEAADDEYDDDDNDGIDHEGDIQMTGI